MCEVSLEARWASGEPGVRLCSRELFDFQTSHLSAVRVVIHDSSQCVGHKLMPIANAHERHPLCHSLPYPFGCRFAPGVLIGHHGPRARDDRRTVLSGLGQRFSFIHLHYVHGFGPAADGCQKPLGKIACDGSNVLGRCARLDQQQRLIVHEKWGKVARPHTLVKQNHHEY